MSPNRIAAAFAGSILLASAAAGQETQVNLAPEPQWVLAGDKTGWGSPAAGVLAAPKGLDRTEEAVAFLPGEQVADGVVRLRFRMTSWPHYIQAKLIFRSQDTHRFYMFSAFSMATDMGFTKEEGLMGLALLRGEASGYRRLLRYVPYLPWRQGYWYELRLDLRGPLIRISLYSELEKRDKPLITIRDQTYAQGALGLAASGPVEFKDLRVARTAPAPQNVNWENATRRPWWPAWAGGPEPGSMPKLVRLKDGALLLAASELYFRPGPPAQVLILKSKDGGRTWNELSGAPVGYAGLLMADGDSVLLFDSYALNEDGSIRRISQDEISSGKAFQFVPHVRKSGDGGRTWSDPAPLKIDGLPWPAADKRSINMFVPPRVLSDGAWLLPVFTGRRDADPAAWEAYMLRSSDGGGTWRASVIDPNHEDASETEVIELEPGRLLALLRTNYVTGYHGETRSRDGGQTWSPVTLGALPGSSSGPRMLKTRAGILLCMHRLLGTMVSSSADLGQTWTTWQIDSPIEVMGDLLELADGRVLAVYSAGGWGGIPRLQYLKVTGQGLDPAP